MSSFEEINGPWLPDEDDLEGPLHSTGPRQNGERPTRKARRNSNLFCQGITPEMEDAEFILRQDAYSDMHRCGDWRLKDGFSIIFADGDDEEQ